jgi:hypothetical protein
MKTPFRPAITGVLAIALASFSAWGAAEDELGADLAPRWSEPSTFMLTPYIWFLGLDGSIDVDGRVADIDAGFVDIVDASDSVMAIFIDAEWRRDGNGFLMEEIFTRVVVDEEEKISSADVVFEFNIIEIAGSWEFARRREFLSPARPEPGEARLDYLFGLRYTHVKSSVTIAVGPLAGSSTERSDLFDPFLGLRATGGLTQELSYAIRADIGGFGLGHDLTWNVRAAIGWNGNVGSKDSVLAMGYRALSMDHKEGGTTIDVIIHGLTLNWVIAF